MSTTQLPESVVPTYVCHLRRRMVGGSLVGALGLAAVTPAASAATYAQTVDPASTTVTYRFGGDNRYASAAAIAAQMYPTGGRSDIVLASGENLPDGLTASGLAGALGAPLLLTATDTFPSETMAALAATTTGVVAPRIHIVGGLSAISQSVRDQLTTLGYTLVESYSGTDREDTAAKVATAIQTISGIGTVNGLRTAIVATDQTYADALAAGGLSAASHIPILLTDPLTLSTETSEALISLGIQQVVIIGGEAAVSSSVATALGAAGTMVIRLGGTDRRDTALLLAAFADANFQSLGYDRSDRIPLPVSVAETRMPG